MSITLDAITLPEGLRWEDENNWSPVAQNKKRTLTGALIVTSSVKLKGRPVSLRGKSTESYMTRLALSSLVALFQSNASMQLNVHGDLHTVKFDYERDPLVAVPVLPYWEPTDDDLYTVSLSFITV